MNEEVKSQPQSNMQDDTASANLSRKPANLPALELWEELSDKDLDAVCGGYTPNSTMKTKSDCIPSPSLSAFSYPIN